jgi:riboflavin synthase
MGRVRSLQTRPAGAVLRIDAANWNHDPNYGDSIAVNGCCLTVAAQPANSNALIFDIVPQTLRMTTLGCLKAGDFVNLEHSVTPRTLLGGHLMHGHVDSVGEVIEATDAGERRLRVRVAPDLMTMIAQKGSIAVEGVSLTVADTGEDWFDVALIPTTINETTLGGARVGTRLNIETDYIARLVANYLQRSR